MSLKLIDTVLLKKKTGVDQFSQNTYDDEEEVSVRFNNEQKLVKDEKGLEFTSDATIYYTDPTAFSIGDAVKLKDSSDDFRVIREIDNFRNGSGTRFFNIAYI